MRPLLPILSLLSGCGAVSLNLGGNKTPDDVDTSVTDTAEGVTVEEEGCEEITIKHTGEDDFPVLGESWHVFLKCDGSTLTGPSVLTFDPTDFASIDVNYVTFLVVGTGTMKLQVGGYWETMEVTVAAE